ncbi:GOP-1-related, partial [Plasmodium yoelii yoelii]
YYFEKLVNINLNNVNTNNFTELLRKITQIIIWGDKHDDQIFQYFCEDNIFTHFIYLLRQDINKTIRIQVYQSLTLLIQNLQKDISLYYIFSNNKINNLIYTTFINQDEDIIPYYISMIKSISFFLNYDTSKFFFNEKNKKFPLYTESLRLYKFNDIITRTYVKNIILNIFKSKFVHLSL